MSTRTRMTRQGWTAMLVALLATLLALTAVGIDSAAADGDDTSDEPPGDDETGDEATDEVLSGDLPNVTFLTTGGTIQNMKLPDGNDERIDLEETVENIRERYPQPEVAAILDSIEPTYIEVTRIGSGSFDLDEFLSLSLEAQEAVDGGADAVVVTQGTFSSEYTCSFLNYLVNTDKPIIVTNAQRQHMSVGNDGDRNLLDSILVATASESVGKGALQVEGAEIVSCREVTKNSDRPGAFGAQELGVLGYVAGGTLGMGDTVADDNVVYYRQPTRQHTSSSEFSIRDLVLEDGSFKELPRVEILPTQYGAQPDIVEAWGEIGVDGIVLEGLSSGGNPFTDQGDAVAALADEGVAVVRTHTNSGQYDRRITPSTEGPYIGGDNLPSHKARILLQLALDKTENLSGEERREEIQRLFNTH